MVMMKSQKIAKNFLCENCNYNCSNKFDFNKHLLTTKHKMIIDGNQKSQKIATPHSCECGKLYKFASGLSRHKNNCNVIKKGREPIENQIIETGDIDYKSMFLKTMEQNNELMNIITSQAEKSEEMMCVMKDIIPKIGNNNTTNTTNNNNQFNLQVFLNEDCKDAINFSDFIKQIQVSFEDVENQAESGYVKGISKLFIENLQGLGTNKRPIHCTDKKRKTLYIKENDEWDKEGSQEVMQKGIQEVTRQTMITLMKEKENRAEEYADMDSEFSEKCLCIQRNLIPTAPRETAFDKVIENITKNSGIIE